MGKGSPDNIKVALRKWITIKIKTTGISQTPLTTRVTIKGRDIDIKESVSTSKPLRIALFPGVYKFFFQGSSEYEPFTTKNIDIGERSLIIAEMRYKKAQVKIVVRDINTKKPIPEASIWTKDKLLGEADKNGEWKGLLEYGKNTLGIIAKGYIGQTITEDIKLNEKKEIDVDLMPEAEVPVSTVPAESNLEIRSSLQEVTSSVGSAVRSTVGITTGQNVSEALSKNVAGVINRSTETVKNIQMITVTCSYCGKVYHIPSNKKLRFCTNCGKPLKY